MTKSCFTGFVFLNIALVLYSCYTKSPEAERFEQTLIRANLQSEDSTAFVVWNSRSCGGCRSYTSRLLQEDRVKSNVKLIVPLSFALDVTTASKNVFIDSLGVFDEYYYGVDNIGIIRVQANEVISIKNYKSNEMELLASDLAL